jgi:amidase
MLVIKGDAVVYKMSGENKPAASCKSGDVVVFETNDCFGNQIQREDQVMNGLDWNNINPATGPLYVDQAQPGDVLKVEILKIELDDHGAICEGPGEGITGKAVTDEATKIVPIKAGYAHFNDKLIFKIKPMIGVIGTAPAEGKAIDTGTPDSHGGNMDCNQIGQNTVLYLPVNVPGALLAMGDMHAVMGNGEVCVCGVEIAGKVTVRVSVLKNCGLPTPFLLTQDKAMTIFSAPKLEQAAEGATLSMRTFLIQELGMDEHEAGFLLSAAGDVEICQCVDPQQTCRMEISRYITDQYGYVFA